MRWALADNKNYQKTQSRTASKRSTGNVAIQSIKYLIMNPLDVNYNITQEYTSAGTTHAQQSYSY